MRSSENSSALPSSHLHVNVSMFLGMLCTVKLVLAQDNHG